MYRLALIYLVCFSLCQVSLAESTSGPGIISKFHDIQENYVIPYHQTDENPYVDFMHNLDTQIHRLLRGSGEIIGDSYKYIEKNKDNPKVRGSKEYSQVVSIAGQLINFHDIKAGLIDNGCLDSDSKTVRALSAAVLENAMSSILVSDCLSIKVLGETENKFTSNIVSILRCIIETGGASEIECDIAEIREKGMLDYSNASKFKLVEGIKRHKDILDKNNSALLDYVFTGVCEGGTELCTQAKKMLPSAGRDSMLSRVNEKLSNIPEGDKNKEEKHRAELSHILRFASQEAINKCTPEIYKYINGIVEGKLAKIFSVLNPTPELSVITKDDLDCIHKKTKELISEQSDKRSKKYKRDIEQIRGSVYTANGVTNLKRGGIGNKLNDTLKSMVMYEPMAVGRYLVNEGSQEDFFNLCNTIKLIAKDLEKSDAFYNGAFWLVNVAGLVVIGAAAVVAGPVSLAVTGALALVALIDGALYAKQEGEFKHKAKAVDNINTKANFVRGLTPQAEAAVFKREMDRRLKFIDKEKSARFWKKFAFVSALTAGTASSVKLLSKGAAYTGSANSGAKGLVSHIAKGGSAGSGVANSLTRLVAGGEKVMADLMRALSNPSKFAKVISKAKAAKSSDKLSKVSKVHHSAEHFSSLYWAKSYGKETLKDFHKVVKGVASSQAISLGNSRSTLHDLDKYLK